MDLKKMKKLKRKVSRIQIEYRKFTPVHIYRSEDKNAPFSEWERITKKPYCGENYRDRDAEENMKFYYYQHTEVDEFGNESEPIMVSKDTYTFNGDTLPRTPEAFIVGINYYWSTDPDLPLEEWTKMFDKPQKIQDQQFKCPVKEPFYFYGKYVNALGDEMGLPSDVQRIVPRP